MIAPGWAEQVRKKLRAADRHLPGGAFHDAKASDAAFDAELSRLCVSREEFDRVREALAMIANGHGCPMALASNAMEASNGH